MLPQEFSPSPEETKGLIKTYYAVPRVMLVRFTDDSIDNTNELAQLLQGSSPVAQQLNLTVRTLPGDHIRPMQQAIVDLPPDVARMANQAVTRGGGMIGERRGGAPGRGEVEGGVGGGAGDGRCLEQICRWVAFWAEQVVVCVESRVYPSLTLASNIAGKQPRANPARHDTTSIS